MEVVNDKTSYSSCAITGFHHNMTFDVTVMYKALMHTLLG